MQQTAVGCAWGGDKRAKAVPLVRYLTARGVWSTKEGVVTRRGMLLTVLLAFLLGLSLAGAAQTFDPMTFVFATNEEPDTLDPAVTYANTSFREVYVLYDRLVTYSGASVEAKPMLATSWDVSDDGLTYTFHLRNDVKFHDGTALTANAVLYSFIRTIEIGKGPSGLYYGIIDKESGEVVDDYTFRLHLRQSFPPLIPLLGMTMGAIVNPTVESHAASGDHGEAWLAENSAGSGPFVLESWKRGQELTLAANKSYWGGAPKLQRVVIKVVPEASTMRLMLENGEIDMAEGVGMDAIPALQKTDGIVVDIVDGMFIQYLCLNNEKGVFADKRLRQAVAHAVDFDSIIQGVYLGYAIRLRSPIPKPLLGYDETLPLYDFNLGKAAALLKEAGKEAGFTVEFLIEPNPNWVKMATAIQSTLKKIGITANIQQYAWATYLDKVMAGEYDLCLMGWSPDYGDPDQNMWTHLHSSNAGPGWNLARYKNQQVDDWMFQARQTNDPVKRAEDYRKAQELAIADSPYVWICQVQFIPVYRSWVKGYTPNPMMNYYIAFDKVYKEK